MDDFGDGWNGALYLLRDTTTNGVVVSGTLTSGAYGIHSLCLGSGCYSLEVTEGDYAYEISWTFGAASGGAPYSSQFLIADGAISGPYEQSSCPTTAPTVSLLPSLAPTSTPLPSVTNVPSKLPTTIPTPSPTAAMPFEARTWAELNNALQVDRARVDAKQDIEFTDAIDVTDGQTVTVLCGNSTEIDVEYCATFDGMSSTHLFNVHNEGSVLRLFHLRLTSGFYSVSMFCKLLTNAASVLLPVVDWRTDFVRVCVQRSMNCIPCCNNGGTMLASIRLGRWLSIAASLSFRFLWLSIRRNVVTALSTATWLQAVRERLPV